MMKSLSVSNDVKTIDEALAWVKEMEAKFKMPVDGFSAYRSHSKFNKETKKYEKVLEYNVSLNLRSLEDEYDYEDALAKDEIANV